MSSKQPPASVGTGDGEELSPEQAAERKAACQQISDGLQASVVLGINVEKNRMKWSDCDHSYIESHLPGPNEW